MSSRLFFSNSLEALADRLIANLDGGDPFDSTAIATPTPAMRGWLQTRIAEKKGIAVNLGFQLLESLLWQRLADLDQYREAPDRQPARLLDATSFQGLILDQLRKNPPAALRAYLVDPAFEPEPYDEARRLCQLAGRLAALFREYEYSRVTEGGFRGLAETWNRGEACFEQYLLRLPKNDARRAKLAELRELEAWQREIYQALFRREEGLRDHWGKTTGIYRYTLPQFAEMVLDQQNPVPHSTGGIGRAKVHHLFGLSHVSPFHRALIRRLSDEEILKADSTKFEIYALNPCAEYWEDALTPREQRSAKKYQGWHRVDSAGSAQTRLTEEELQAEELPIEAEENELLNRFGKPGRETVKLWNQVTDYDFSGFFQERSGNTVLTATQRALLRRHGPLDASGRIEQDPSLQIWSAPDLHAEVEAVKAHLAEMLLEDPKLRLEEIAVIPADFETYLPVLEAIFGGDEKRAGFVPFCLPEAGMLRESVLLRGFRDLLELGSGPFRRNALLAFLENPAVQKKLRLDAAMVEAIGEFLSRSGFQEGWDAEHQRLQGAASRSLSTLEKAEPRSLLGLIMDPLEPIVADSEFHPAPEASLSLDREELSRCLELLENLKQDLHPFRSGEKLTFLEWSTGLRSLLNDYFAADKDEALETTALSGLQRFFMELEQWNAWETDRNEGVSHHVISTLLEDHFRDPRAARMSFLAGGVRIGSLNALRGLPFRMVYVPGLNAGTFPAPREAAPLDLRSHRRVLGETDPATRDLYALLEILSATSERLILSHVRLDNARDSLRQPSHALTGLMSYLESDILNASFVPLELDVNGRYPPQEIPSGKWDASPRPRLETLRMQVLANLPQLEALALADAKAQPPAIPSLTAKPPADSKRIDLRDVAEYLRDPAAHAIFRNFRLYNPLDAEDENDAPPLFLDKWKSQDFLATVLRAELCNPGAGGDTAQRNWKNRFFAGQTPPPPYSTLENERLQQETRSLIAGGIHSLRAILPDLNLRFEGTLRLGGQSSRPLEPPILSLPAFDANPLGIDNHIEGDLPFFFRGTSPEGGWALLLNGRELAEVTAYLLHLCAASLGAWKGSGYVFILMEEEIEIFKLPDVGQAEAEKNLRILLEAFLQAPDFDHLPLTLVDKILKSDPGKFGETENWPERLEQKERDDAESGFGFSGYRARVLRAIHPEIPADAAAKIEQRLLPFLSWKKSWKEVEA